MSNEVLVAYRDRMKVALLFVLLCFAGCTKRNPEVCCTTQADCDAIGLPLGTDCEDGLTCIGNRCVAATTCQAESDCPAELPKCGPDGVCVECIESTECGDQICSANQCVSCTLNEECPTGLCLDAACRSSIIPKYLPNVCDVGVPDDLVLADAIDTNSICTEVVVQGGGAPEICVIHARTITLPGGTIVDVTGTRALALVADQELTIEGLLNGGANRATPGPGASGTSGGVATDTRGGGGAGFKTDGAAGGTTVAGGGSNGGAAMSDPSAQSVFFGGTSNSGGGGGAITLISCRDSVVVTETGTVSVGGGGGGGGTVAGIAAGGGGGSGGYVVIQGVAITVAGGIFANGGGGGGGAIDRPAGLADIDGRPGNNGSQSATSPGSGGDAGGDGGFGVAPPTVGGASITNAQGDISAGGGGSTGFLQTYLPAGVTPDLANATASPAFEATLEVSTR